MEIDVTVVETLRFVEEARAVRADEDRTCLGDRGRKVFGMNNGATTLILKSK